MFGLKKWISGIEQDVKSLHHKLRRQELEIVKLKNQAEYKVGDKLEKGVVYDVVFMSEYWRNVGVDIDCWKFRYKWAYHVKKGGEHFIIESEPFFADYNNE